MAEYSEEIPSKVANTLLDLCADELQWIPVNSENRDKMRTIVRVLRTLTLPAYDPVRKAFYDGHFRTWRDIEATFNDMERLIEVGEALDIENKHKQALNRLRKVRSNEDSQS